MAYTRTPYNASGTNADAVISIPRQSAQMGASAVHIAWSYSAAPTGGRLLIKDGDANGTIDGSSVTLYDLDITSAGPGPYNIQDLCAPAGRGLNITLKAGGSAVVGKINAISAV